MINYIIQVVLFQVLFLAIYDFFLSKETFFTKNRWYLLSTPVLSFLLPLIKIPTFQKAVSQEFIVNLPEIILSPEKVIQEASWYQNINYIDAIFGIGVIIFSILFFAKLVQIVQLIRSYKLIKKDGYTLVLIPKQTKAFSFFNYIFLGKEIPESQKDQIILHELVHSKQKHSLDLLFFEFLKIVMWFNPMIFIYQKRITLVHEYISDEVATKSAPKENYINQLLSNFFQVENIAFINQFYKQSLIKKRIIMMKKKQSKKMNQLKYLVLIPALISMLFYTSCSESELKDTYSKQETQTLYRNFDGKLKIDKGNKETYLDSYMGRSNPIDAKEISYDDLSKEEKNEFEERKMKIDELTSGKFLKVFDFKLFKMKNGRNAIAMVIDFNKDNFTEKEERLKTKDGSVNFLKIEKAPTYPGCEFGDKACFSIMVQKHFAKKFNADLPSQLGLKSGKKRVFVGFKVDKSGNIIDIEARGPHPKLEEEIIGVMSSLPKMTPGESKGEKVAVTYNIPLAILVK